MRSGEIADSLGRGEILAGKYRVERVIGEGGMGQVYAAEHMQLGHRVAKIDRALLRAAADHHRLGACGRSHRPGRTRFQTLDREGADHLARPIGP